MTSHGIISSMSTLPDTASTPIVHVESDRVLLRPDHEYDFAAWTGSTPALRVGCLDVEQRNWSRVAAAVPIGDRPNQTARYFLKQYVDRSGQWHEKLWTHEREATELAAEVLCDLVTIPPIVRADESLLVNVYRHVDLVSLDVLLRDDPAAFSRRFPAALSKMAEVLEVLAQGVPDSTRVAGLTAKRRSYGSSPDAINFKGFDIRNVAFLTDAGGHLLDGNLAMFDFGKAYLAPVEEAAAKLLISVGLLNWGRPIRRFMLGPDLELLEIARAALEPFLDAEALRAELSLQRKFRSRDAQGSGLVEQAWKRLGIGLVGRRYLQKLEQWCAGRVA